MLHALAQCRFHSGIECSSESDLCADWLVAVFSGILEQRKLV